MDRLPATSFRPLGKGHFEIVPDQSAGPRQQHCKERAEETDMNVVMNDNGDFIEVQGTAEGHPFNPDELNAMLDLAKQGIDELLASQQAALAS